jgi:5'-nucleotidase (lipoprotein e(P4) family)
MQLSYRTQLPFVGVVVFAFGWLSGQCCTLSSHGTQAPPDAVNVAADPRLKATLYMQTSAEYRACCLGIYKAAELRLENLLSEKRDKPARPAVVMDLDETVLDNSVFQTNLLRKNEYWTEKEWAHWEENGKDVGLIPGARRFIIRAGELGVKVVFISNRSEERSEQNEQVLKRLKIDADGVNRFLFLKKENEKSSSKASRQELVAAKFNVVMYFGDNLRDFSESFQAGQIGKDPSLDEFKRAIQKRNLLVDDASCHWGIDWFVLPNPVYGEWEKLIGNPAEKMLRTSPSE